MTRPNHPALPSHLIENLAQQLAEVMALVNLADKIHPGFGPDFIDYAHGAHGEDKYNEVVSALLAMDLPDTIPADWA